VCVVTEGALSNKGAKDAPNVIDTGDLVLLPRGAGDLRLTASGTPTTIIVCRFWFDPDSLRGMIFALPRCIHIPRADSAGWLERERPEHRWSIETLAGIAGMSRSSFCERFTTLVGRSPLRYRNEWRLMLARELLAKRDARVGEVGLAIGYESEAAFSRAYKAFFGHSPRVTRG